MPITQEQLLSLKANIDEAIRLSLISCGQLLSLKENIDEAIIMQNDLVSKTIEGLNNLGSKLKVQEEEVAALIAAHGTDESE